MFHLDKTHDPRKNWLLLEQMNEKQISIEENIKETEKLFNQCRENGIPAFRDKTPAQSSSFHEKS